MKTVYKTLFFLVAYNPVGRPYPWKVGPHPLWANRIVEWLHGKWLEDE